MTHASSAFALLACVALAAVGACSPSTTRGTTDPAQSTVQNPAPRGAQNQKSSQESEVAEDRKHAGKGEGNAAKAAGATELATFGAGCFWCVEAVLEQLDGVLDVKSGYMGGSVRNPSYDDVCGGETGHAEVVQVTFDPARISYAKLLEWFFKLHDPTTLNRQGPDQGTQYRSVVFFHSDAQREAAERAKVAVGKLLDDPVVTEIAKADTLWSAEGYHQDYYRRNREAPYCRAMITPKLEKLGLEK